MPMVARSTNCVVARLSIFFLLSMLRSTRTGSSKDEIISTCNDYQYSIFSVSTPAKHLAPRKRPFPPFEKTICRAEIRVCAPANL